MKQRIKIGVLGAANIALRSVVPSIKLLDKEFELVGIATRTLKENIPNKENLNFIEGYENLLDKNDLEAIYIPLPNSMHYEWVKKSLDKGLHVLVEKSLGCNYAEVKELNEIAKEKNLVLVENFQFRFHNQLKFVLDLLKNNELGDLRIVRSTFCFPPFPDKDNIRYKKDLGGGALLDAGAYPIKLSQIVLGENIEVSSSVLNKENGSEVDIWGGAFLTQKGGSLFSQIAFGFDNYYQCSLEIIGSEGKLYTNRIFTAGEKITPKMILETKSNGYQEISLKPDNHFKNMLYHFHQLIQNDADREFEYTSNINQARLIDELQKRSED